MMQLVKALGVLGVLLCSLRLSSAQSGTLQVLIGGASGSNRTFIVQLTANATEPFRTEQECSAYTATCVFNGLAANEYSVAVIDPANNFTIATKDANVTNGQPAATTSIYIGSTKLLLGLEYPGGSPVQNALVLLQAADARTGKLQIVQSKPTDSVGRVLFETYTSVHLVLKFVMMGRSGYNLKYREPISLDPIPPPTLQKDLGSKIVQRGQFCKGNNDLDWSSGRYPPVPLSSVPSLNSDEGSAIAVASSPQPLLYTPGTICMWTISPPNPQTMRFLLSQIDIGPEDALLVAGVDSNGKQKVLQQIQPSVDPGSYLADVYLSKMIVTLIAGNSSSSYGSGFMLAYDTTVTVEIHSILLVMLLWVFAVISGSSIFAILLYLWRRRQLAHLRDSRRHAVPAEESPGITNSPEIVVKSNVPSGSFDELLVTFRDGRMQVVKLPREAYAGLQTQHSDEAGEEDACSICLNAYALNDELRRLPCNHFFHSDCIDCWLHKDVTCPLCKGKIYQAMDVSPSSSPAPSSMPEGTSSGSALEVEQAREQSLQARVENV